ncbi:MAG: aminotransferase class V-fold PLP-dependent enzyme [Pirellulaceae bacterium]|jgi:dTDP-4-amino-4,6-dideoxygalactose transaminase|nr:aminotransferase class V-fold PLP-dependent enzyme [Pirellulaceae bacterium]MDP7014558.1 aminotransferase class V-fold PLP-dependent enzyme [Pirellulaceae bacterium]
MTEQLAIDGGLAEFPDGPPTWPTCDDAVRDSVLAALTDGGWGRYEGEYSERLREQLRQMHNVEHVVLCASGTIAVEMALRGLRIGEADEVLLAGYDFSGNFRAVECLAARPALVDIEPRTWCLDAEQLMGAASPATKAIVVSHLHGGLADMEQIRDWADDNAVAIVEDACQAPGSVVNLESAGSLGDVGVLSFGGSKLLTAGRGGALLTNDSSVRQRIRVHYERGNQAAPLSELQAAALIPQVESLDERNQRRRNSVERLLRQLDCGQLRAVANPAGRGAASYFKVAFALTDQHLSRDEYLRAFRAEGLALDDGFRGFTRRSNSRRRVVGELTHAARAAEQTLVLHHPVLLQPPAVVDRVARAINKVCAQLGQRARD